MSSSKGTSLSDRFKALRTAVTAEQQDPEVMTIEELSMMKITFGEAKRGQTYREVLQTDPKYVSWFLSRYQDSSKPAHKAFVSYLRRCIEEEETNRGVTMDVPQVTSTKGYPKAKASSALRPASTEENAVWLSEGMWDVVEEDHENHLRDLTIEHQNHRLDQLESTLQAILQVLTPNNPKLEAQAAGTTQNETK